MREVKVYPDPASLAQAAAGIILRQALILLAETERFSLVLAGGSTPQATYRMLASLEYASQIDWRRVHIFFGDERCVMPDHPDSNYAMASQSLLEHVPIPAANIHRMRGESNPEKAAAQYENELRQFFPQTALPAFDLALLGMGEDGHVASLFPGSMALLEEKRWVVAVEHPCLARTGSHPPAPLVDRLSLTLPAFNSARQVVILVAGANKTERLEQVLSDLPDDSQPLPAQLIRPSSQKLLWLLDEAAAPDHSSASAYFPAGTP